MKRVTVHNNAREPVAGPSDVSTLQASIRYTSPLSFRRTPIIPVSIVMSSSVTCLHLDMDLDEARDILLESGFATAPVVDDQWRPIGLIRLKDLLGEFEAGEGTSGAEENCVISRGGISYAVDATFHLLAAPQVLVAQRMRTTFSVLPADAPLSRASLLLSKETIPSILVTDFKGRVIGMLTRGDIARWVASQLDQRKEEMTACLG